MSAGHGEVRPFRFGTVTTGGTSASRRGWVEHVRRVEGLGFSIVRRLHEGDQVSHTGEFYRLRECELSVETVQQPIPLLPGGGGPRMTRFAAEHADIVGFVLRSLPQGA
jgi:alkanesulfonate monooxygenase SsuD/methylene tetrahydromethanopterin reductase-like flavin-dependent oxidoreductase (luciferase family)